MGKHMCHRPGCTNAVPPKMFACRGDWFSLPVEIRNRILDEYTPGQEIRKDPSEEWLDAAMDALAYWDSK